MPEVGLVSLARHAVTIARLVLPRYRSKFSKHQFTQPQLLALLCVMRYEDWTFREAEVRLREHRELRRALGLRTVPNYTTLYRFLHRVDETALRTAVGVVAHVDPLAQVVDRHRCRHAGTPDPRGPARSIQRQRDAAADDRERFLRDQTQALDARPRPFALHAAAPSLSAGPHLQPLPLEVSPTSEQHRFHLEDVNRARQTHVSPNALRARRDHRHRARHVLDRSPGAVLARPRGCAVERVLLLHAGGVRCRALTGRGSKQGGIREVRENVVEISDLYEHLGQLIAYARMNGVKPPWSK